MTNEYRPAENSCPELTTAHSQSSYGIPVLIINGQAYGPKDSIQDTGFASGTGRAATAAYWAATTANGSDDPAFREKARLFCSQWPFGPRPNEEDNSPTQGSEH